MDENSVKYKDYSALQNLTIEETQGQRIKKIRQSLGLTQSAIGDVLNMSKQYFSKAETDLIVLNNRQLVTLCVDYNVNINYLLTGKGDMFITENKPKELGLAQRLDRLELALRDAGILINS